MDQDKQYLLADEMLSDGTVYSRPSAQKQNRFRNWNMALLSANIILLIAGLAVWVRVHGLLKGFSCDPREDVFEPDRKFPSTYPTS